MPNPQPDPEPAPDPEGGAQYFATSPGAPSRPAAVELVLPEGRLVHLATDAGVFSGDRVDQGTRILLAEADPLGSAPVVADVGCGYGPVAITMALRADPGTVVWAVDVNERALDLCRSNAEANGVGSRVRTATPAEVPDDLVVDRIWSNPPIRIGKPSLHALLAGWLDRLRPGTGTATFVVHKHLGADSLARWLVDQGWPTERSASRAGYRILTVGARGAGPSDTGGAGTT